MNKIVLNLQEAVADIPDGAVVLIGGFGGCGDPANLIRALVELGSKNLTVAANDFSQWAPLAQREQVSTLISGFTGSPFRPEYTAMVKEQLSSGVLKRAETVPHGTLEERIRAGGMGLGAFYTPVGLGTAVEEGKEKRTFDGQEYILERAIRADYALIKGHKADRFGNVFCRLSAGNRNITMAMAARVTIAEVEEIVEIGELDPQTIHIPGIFVKRVIKVPKVAEWLAGHEKV